MVAGRMAEWAALLLRSREGRRVLHNSGWMMAEQALRLLVGLGLSVWMARQLGPHEFGRFSYAVSFASVFGVAATLGLNRILVRELVLARDDPSAVDRLMATAFALRLGAALLVYLLCVGLALFTREDGVLLVALVAGCFFFSASDCIELLFQSRGEARRTAQARLLAFLAISAVRVALLLAAADVLAFAAAALLECVFGAVALHLTLRRHGGSVGVGGLDVALGLRLLRESWPEIAAGFSGLLFVRMDQLMLEHLQGPAAVGAFAVAARLAEAWYFVPTAIIAATFPAILAARERGGGEYMRRIQMLMLGLCLLSYLVAVGALLLAGPGMRWLFGVAYDASGPVLSVLMWSGLFVSLGLVSGSWMAAEKRMRLNLWRNLAGLAANVALNLVLIPRHGPVGAAWATLLSLAIAYLLFDALVPAMREVSRAKWRALLVWPALGRA